VKEIQGEIIEEGEQNVASPYSYAKDGKKTVDAWRFDLDRILHVFIVRYITSA